MHFYSGRGWRKKEEGNTFFKAIVTAFQRLQVTLKATCFAPTEFAPLKSLQTFYFEFNLTFNGLKNEKYAKTVVFFAR